MAAKFLPYLLAGISVGGQYALIAIGYTMVYGILRLINFAHGDIFTVAGFLMVYATASLPLTISPVGGGGQRYCWASQWKRSPTSPCALRRACR